MTSTQITQALNIVFIGIIVFGALLGSLRGLKKSVFQLAFSLFFLIVAVLLIPYIAEAIMNANVSALKKSLPEPVEGNTLKEVVVELLKARFPDQQAMFQPGSETLGVIYGTLKLVIVLILFLVFFIINATFNKLLMLILWQFVKPEKGDNKHKLTGALFGGARGVLTVFLIAIPLVGLASIYGSVNRIMKTTPQEGTQTEASFEEFNYFEAYNDTWVSKAFGSSNLDEKLFDSVFQIQTKIEGKKKSFKIRNDLHHGSIIYEVLYEANEGKFNQDLLFKLSKEDVEILKKHIAQTEILSVIQAVGAEAFYETIIDKQLDIDYEDFITLPALKKINLKQDLITLLEVVNIINEVEFSGPIEEYYFKLSKDQASRIIETLSEVEWIKYGLPMGLNFTLQSDSMQQLMLEYDIQANDITKPNPDGLIDDFINIKNLYGILKDMGIQSLTEAQDLLKPDQLTTISDADITSMVDTIFGFSLIDSNKKLIAAFGHNLIDQQPNFQGFINKDDFIDKFSKDEVKYILLFTKLLIENDAFNPDLDYQAFLTEDTINNMAHRISRSEILSDQVPFLIDTLFSSLSSSFTFEVPHDVSYKQQPGETELKNLFTAAREILRYDLQNASFDLSTISDDNIEELSETLSLSETIKHNISPLLADITSSRSYSFVSPDYPRSHWTKDELYYTLIGLKRFEVYHITNANFNTLDDTDIHLIAQSITITDAFKEEIFKMNGVGGDIEGKLVIDDNIVWHSTSDTPGELERLALAIKEVQGNTPISSFDPSLDLLFGKDLDIVFASSIIEKTMVENHLKTYIMGTPQYFNAQDLSGNPYKWYGTPSDSKDFIIALSNLHNAGIDYKTMDFNAFKTLLQTPGKPREINDAIIGSKIFVHSLNKMMNELINNQGGYAVPIDDGGDPNYWGSPGVDGKLFEYLNLIASL